MEGDITSEDGKGIIPRAVEALFQGVVESDENIEFTFRVSYVEIYLEKIRDLLDEHRTKTNLAIREDKLKGVYIAGVTEEYVTSVEELLQVMHVGKYCTLDIPFVRFLKPCVVFRCPQSCDSRDGHERRFKSFPFSVYYHCHTKRHSNKCPKGWQVGIGRFGWF